MRTALLGIALGVTLSLLSACRREDPAVGKAVASIVAQALQDPDDVDTQVNALAALGESAVPYLGPALRHPDQRIRMMAIDALGKMRGASAVDALLAALEDSSWEVRQEAVEALGNLRSARAVRPLLDRYASDDDAQVRYECLTSLGLIGDPSATPLLVRETASEDVYVRMWAMSALCDARATEASELVLKVMDDSDIRVRRQVLRACGKTIRTDAFRRKLLRVTLDDPDFELSYVARDGLVEDYRAQPDGDARRLIEEEAKTAFKSGDPSRKLRGTFLLANLGEASTFEALVAALHDDDPLIRHHAAYLLSEIRDERAVPPLAAALRDEVPAVRLTAMISLKRYADAGNAGAREAMASFQASGAAR